MTGQARFAGKRALVTGGSRGIGAAIVRRLAADGASEIALRKDRSVPPHRRAF